LGICQGISGRRYSSYVSCTENFALTAVTGVLVSTVTAIVVPIASPHSGDTSAVSAGKFASIARDIFWHAHSIFVYQSTVVVALAFRGTIMTRMTGLITTAVIDVARINAALLPGRGEYVKISR